jgi:uncharacterized membrane protein YkoI
LIEETPRAAACRTPRRQARRVAAAALLLALPCATVHAGAAAHASRSPAAGAVTAWRGSAAPMQRRDLTLDEAVQLVQGRYGARVVRTQTLDEGGRRTYVLRLLSADGRVWSVRVDAASGSVTE